MNDLWRLFVLGGTPATTSRCFTLSADTPPLPGQARNPLHGITLERMLNELVEFGGWDGLAGQIDVRCFHSNPSMASSLKFLRKTPWARAKVESLYLFMLREKARRDKAARGV